MQIRRTPIITALLLFLNCVAWVSVVRFGDDSVLLAVSGCVCWYVCCYFILAPSRLRMVWTLVKEAVLHPRSNSVIQELENGTVVVTREPATNVLFSSIKVFLNKRVSRG